MAEITLSCEWKNCGQRFEAKVDLEKHRKTAHDGKFQCDECGNVLSSFKGLVDHKLTQNHWTSRDPIYPCLVEGCRDPPFRRPGDLREHMEQSHPDQAKPKRYKCYFFDCDSTFKKTDLRTRHERLRHQENFPCTFLGCNVRFDTEVARSAHVSTHESDDSSFVCQEIHCEARFENVEDQLNHEESAHNRSTCRACLLSFDYPEDLVEHVWKVHSSGTGFCCAHCRHPFAGKRAASDAVKHMDKHVGGQATAARPFRLHEVAEGGGTLILLEDMSIAKSTSKSIAKSTSKSIAKSTSKSTAKGPSAIGLARCRNMVAVVGDVFSKPIGAAVLSDAPVVEQFTCYRRLQRFKDLLLALPDVAQASGGAGMRPMEFLESPSLRDISFEVTSEDDEQSIIFSTPDELQFAVSYLGLDASATYNLASCLCDLLSRVPVSVLDLNRSNRKWLLKTAYIRAAEVYSGDGESPFALTEPSLLEDETQQFYYSVPITGYDPLIMKSWTFEQRIYVSDSQDKLASDVASREVSVYQWQHQDPPSSLDTSSLSEVQLQKSLNIAKLIYCRYNGWIGNIYACEKAANDLRGYARKSELAGLKLKLDKKPIQAYWTRGHVHLTLRGTLHWEKLLSVSVSRLYASLPTDDPEHIYSVVSCLLEAISTGHTPDVAWGLFCAAIDTEDERIGRGEPPIPIVSCTGCEEGTHLCPTCLRLRKCDGFVQNLDRDYKICSQCDSDETGKVNLFTKLQAAGLASLAPYLEYNLRQAVARDIKASAGRIAIEGKALESWCEEGLKNMKPLFIDQDTVIDNLVEQELFRHTDAKRTWQNQRRHPLNPSVDAFLRFVRGSNDEVMYHAPGNLNVTSDSVNNMFKHYPKFLGHGIRCIVTAQKYEDYIKGLRVFQCALINDYEMAVLVNIQRSRYLGLPCNDFKEFDQYVEALKSCKPLPRTIAKSIVWRTGVETAPAPDDTEHWKFDDFEYVMAQIRLAAKHYGLDTPELEQCWLRDGKFFPFCQDSIVPRWNHWDCFQYFAQKLKRMRDECDKLFKNQENRPSCSVQELMIVVAHRHMAKVAKDLKEGKDIRMCGRDQAGLLLHPTLKWLLSASIGHDEHGHQMLIGLTGYDPESGTDCIFNPDKCNILWETWACNAIKWCYHRDYYSEIFAQLVKFRETPALNSPVPFASAEEVFSNIRDLTNELASEVDGGAIDPESTYFPKDDRFYFEGDEDDGALSVSKGEDDEDGPLFVSEGDDSEDSEDSEKSDKPDFIFRCTCEVIESIDIPAHLIISCRECGHFQHRECMKVAPDKAPGDYTCELCKEDLDPGVDSSAAKKPDPRFRCPCKEPERLDTPSRPIICCEMCGYWQHRHCFGIPVDAKNLGHTCDKCDPELYETLGLSGESSGKAPGPGTALDRPARRNMGRLNQTCFISAATQLLLAIPQAASIVAGKNTCRLITGRDPVILPQNSPEYGKLGLLFQSLKSVHRQLSTSGRQLERSLTGNLLRHSTTITDTLDDQRWRDIPDNASEYLMYLIERLVCVSDTSSHETLCDGRTAQFVFEKELENRSKTQRLDDLEEDIKTAIAAYEASGNQSGLAEALTVHMVRESQCMDCDTVLRKFQHDTRLFLKLPEDIPAGKPLTLLDLIGPYYEDGLGSQGPCQHCHLSLMDIEGTEPAEKWRKFGSRILNAPEILIVEIDRLRPGTGLGMNRVYSDSVIDLKDLQSRAQVPSLKHRDIVLEGETRYERVGLLAYLGDFNHWIACIKEGPGKNGRWVLYDDTKAVPEFKSPEEISDPGFCECLIVYRKVVGEPEKVDEFGESEKFDESGEPEKVDKSGEPEKPLIEGLSPPPQGGQAGTGWNPFDDYDATMFNDMDSGTDNANSSQFDDDQTKGLGIKSQETTDATTDDAEEKQRILKELADTKKELADIKKKLIYTEQKSKTSVAALQESKEKFLKQQESFLKGCGIYTGVGNPESWWRQLDDLQKELEVVKEVLQRLRIVGSPLALNADAVLKALQKGDFKSFPQAVVEQIEAQLEDMGDVDIRSVFRSVCRRMSSDASLVSIFDAIYRDLIVPTVAGVVGTDDAIRAWDVANERMIRPMLISLVQPQPKKTQPPSPVVITSQNQKSRLPVPSGRARLPRSSTSTLTGTTAGEQSGTGDITAPETPPTAIRQAKDVRFAPLDDLDSDPPTSREHIGETTRKRATGKDRFAGEKLGDESKRLREGEDTSGSDFTQDSPLLNRAKLLEEAARQQDVGEEGPAQPAQQPRPPRGKPASTLKKKSSVASFLRPTESSRGRDVRWNPSSTSLLSTYDDRTLTQNPLGQPKPKTDFVDRLKGVFRPRDRESDREGEQH